MAYTEKNAEAVLKELELRWRLIDDKIDNCYSRNQKIPLIEEQNKIEQKMYMIIDNFPSLEGFIANINKDNCPCQSFIN